MKPPRVVEIDHRHDPRDLVRWLERLAGRRRGVLAALHEDPELDQRGTEEVLELCGGALADAELAVVHFVRDSDSYYLAVVPLAQVRGLGRKVVRFTGKKVEALRKTRLRSAAQHNEGNPWRELGRSAQAVLWTLNTHPWPVEAIRAAAAFAPARDRPLVEMTLALHDGDAVKLARTTRDPALCLHALRYLGQARNAMRRLAATALLADRLKVKPDGNPLHQLVCQVCNLGGEARAVDRAVRALPARSRARLARLAEALLPRRGYLQSSRATDALRALANVGDLASIAVIEAACPDPPQRIAEVLARIRRRC